MPRPRAIPRVRPATRVELSAGQLLRQRVGQRLAATTCAVPRIRAPMRSFTASTVSRSGADSYNDENKVPEFYVRRKEKRASGKPISEEDKAKDPSLMEHLSDGLLSDEIVASTRRLKSKIPKEMYNEDGVLVHPSGYVIPTPADETPARRERERDLAKQTAAVAERVLEEDFEGVTAHTKAKRRKVPVEVRHEDGSVSHPSGFVPPTPAENFDNLFAWEDAENAKAEAQARLRKTDSASPATPLKSGTLDQQPTHTSGTASGESSGASHNPRSTQTDPGDSSTRKTDEVLQQEQRESIQRRKEQEGGLMTELSAGVLAGGVSASTEPRDQKKPTAYATQEGVQTAQHPPEFIEQHPPQRVKNPKKD
ncbi:hypothetical protein K523DRAFT_238698 [Schizophyllum commune Tattone D]|nr:hypothetical protein K525DRAFT_227489 [Schizophyllum commune Loenen D]KAI5830919.1 hypothetical protein K523DRAFT_238698 [Schizophyllum commune Tattone D]